MSSKTKTTATQEEATPALVPKLRFPKFRGAAAWKSKRLGDLFSDRQESGLIGLPLLSLMDKEGIVPQEDSKRKNNSNSDKSKYLRVVPGDIAYNTMRMWEGRSALVGLEGLVSPAYTVCEPQKGVHSLLFSYYFKTPQLIEQFRRYSQGLVKDTLNLKYAAFSQIPAPIPTFPEQQKIASCLSSVDELMAAQARKLDALKTHKKGLMQQLFPREGETQPRLRFPGFQNDGEWVLTSVGGLVEANSLFPPKDGNHGNIHPKSGDYVAQGIPFIMASDLNGGLIDIETCHFISKDQADALQKGFAKEGDVLLSHKGTVDEVAVVRKIHTPYLMLTPQVTYYRVKDPKKLSNEFLAQLYFSGAFQSNLLELSGGGTRSYIGITEQAKLRVQFPKNVAEQQRIASCLSSLDALITAETQKLEALKTHKKGLMQQLFPSPEEVEA